MTSMRKPKGITRHLQLDVTEEIIDRAVRRDSTACVLADALKVACPGGVRPLVDLQTMSITVPEKGLRYHWLTPRSAQRILINFDQGGQLAPEVVRLSQGWTTSVRKKGGPVEKRNRDQRKQELEAGEAAGTLSPVEVRALATMRATDERQEAVDRKREEEATESAGAGQEERSRWTGRPPVASLSNGNGRRYGLRLTRLTQHGEALVNE